MPVPRGRAAGARAARLLVQLAARRLPALHRARPPAGDRPRPARPGSGALGRRGRARALDARVELGLLRRGHRGDRRAVRDRRRPALVGARRGGPRPVPVRHGRRADLRELPQPDGSAALVHARVRGHRVEPPAALPRDGLAAAARADRGVHDAPALPRVPRRAAQAGGPRGDGRRAERPRLHADERAARAPVRGRARAHGDREPDRRADPEGDPRAAHVPRQRRRRLPDARPRGGDALRRRGPAPAARDADRLAARGRALHPRRAVHRTPPARQQQADRDARAAARPRQHGARGRARRADDARRRPSRGHGPGGRRARRARRGRGHREAGRAGEGLGHGPVPLGRARDRGARAAHAGSRLVLGARREHAQPEGDRRRVPASGSSSA